MRVPPLLHLKRAFGWNLGRMAPTGAESAALAASGVTDPVVQRYAVWRRSLLVVALVPTLVVLLVSIYDAIEDGFDGLTSLGLLLEGSWYVAAAALCVACWMGIRSWKRPGASSAALSIAWIVAFVVPFVFGLMPVDAVYHVGPTEPGAAGRLAPDKVAELEEMILEFVRGGAAYLLLLPAVLALIPGAVNGCLRIKALLPAAQIPGWLLVCAAPAFLLFWVVILVVANQAAQSVLLVLGVVLWAGSAVGYALRWRVFVQSQLAESDVARIARVKRAVGVTSFVGIGLLIAFVATQEVAGLKLLGMDADTAMSTHLDELSEDDEVSFADVEAAYVESTSFTYALDLASFQLVIDFLAKLLLATAVFADLVLRAALSAWRNDRALRSRPESSAYDASAEALLAALSSPATSSEAARP